jgi:hypothetical protein
MSGGRYPVLRSLAIIYVIGGALAALSTILSAGYILLGTRFAWSDKLIMCVGALTAGFFLVLTMFAVAEVLKLFIDVEHNTRMAVPGRIGMPAAAMTPAIPASGGMVVTESVTVATSDGNGAPMMPALAATSAAHVNRLHQLDEETAEAALLRGH